MKKYLLTALTLSTLSILAVSESFATEATGSLSSYDVPTLVTPLTLTGVATISGSVTAAASVTVNTGSDIMFNPTGDIRVTIPAGTVITPATGTGFDTTAIVTASATVSSGLGANESSKGAIEFGISTVGLRFTKPVRIDIPVSGVTTSTITVKVKHANSSTFVTTGLTQDENATCDTNGVPSVPGYTATVSNNVATIYSCEASTFTTYTTTVVNNGGGGSGGGGSYVPTPTPVLTNTGTTLVPTALEPVVPGSLEDLLSHFDTLPKATLTTAYIGYKDISKSWAKAYISKLAIRKIVNNSDQFRPNAGLTRAEFIKIITKSLGWTLPSSMETLPYTDVSRSHSLAAYISLAASQGIIGTSADRFRPDDVITRAEAMKILVLALGAEVEATPVTFSDVDKSSDLAKYIEKAKSLGIITGQKIGTRTYFRPTDSVTRAEIAKIIVSALRF